VEALRRQTAREHPDADAKETLRRWRVGAAGAGAWMKSVGQNLSERIRERSAGGRRLDELERLAQLRDAGVLDAAEFQREKQRLLGPPPAEADPA
jgi:hypothetical protein